MGSNRQDTRTQQTLQSYSEADRQRFLQQLGLSDARFQEYLTRAGQPGALEQAEEKDVLDWRNFWNSSDRNVGNAPALGMHLDLYNRSLAGEEGERTPQPMGASWGGQTNAGLRTLLGEQSKRRREREAAGGLERAVSSRDAEVQGKVMPLIGLQNNRNMGLASLVSGQGLGMAGLLGNQSQNSTNSWSQFQPRPSFWSQLLMSGMQGAGQVASAKIQFGCVTLDTPVLTPDGWRPAGEIQENDVVQGITGPQKVTRVRINRGVPVVKVTTASGLKLTCTPSHRFINAQNQEVFLSEMNVGDPLFIYRDGVLDDRIESVEDAGTADVVIHKLDSYSENYGIITNGIISMDDYAVRSANG